MATTRFLLLTLCLLGARAGSAQSVVYPHPVQTISLQIEGAPVAMAFMDVAPAAFNGKTILLLHGKNFNGYYWKHPIAAFVKEGFRVIVPDQVGWGRSDKPRLHYSFHQLARNTKTLLDSLRATRVYLVGHSMGGMLAARFTLMYPDAVEKLVLENPIGLEDYKTFVPYREVDQIFQKELGGTYESYRKYQQSYYPQWKPEYEQYVQAQAEALASPRFRDIALVNALTYQMIYEQPVVYELGRIKKPTLLIIGQEDRTVVGKDLLKKEEAAKYGHYPSLGQKTQQRIARSRLLELKGVGHIPHIQVPAAFTSAVVRFFKE